MQFVDSWVTRNSLIAGSVVGELRFLEAEVDSSLFLLPLTKL